MTAWFAACDNPHQDLMLGIRQFILDVDDFAVQRDDPAAARHAWIT